MYVAQLPLLVLTVWSSKCQRAQRNTIQRVGTDKRIAAYVEL
jgi:hypothetical protein